MPVECAGGGEDSPLGAAIVARGLNEPTTSLAVIAREMAPATRRIESGTAAKF